MAFDVAIENKNKVKTYDEFKNLFVSVLGKLVGYTYQYVADKEKIIFNFMMLMVNLVIFFIYKEEFMEELSRHEF